jgi:hypothetical protein
VKADRRPQSSTAKSTSTTRWKAKSDSLASFEAGDAKFEEQHKAAPEVHHQWAFARQLAGQVIGSNLLGRGKNYSVELSGVPGDSITVTVTQKGDL